MSDTQGKVVTSNKTLPPSQLPGSGYDWFNEKGYVKKTDTLEFENVKKTDKVYAGGTMYNIWFKQCPKIKWVLFSDKKTLNGFLFDFDESDKSFKSKGLMLTLTRKKKEGKNYMSNIISLPKAKGKGKFPQKSGVYDNHLFTSAKEVATRAYDLTKHQFQEEGEHAFDFQTRLRENNVMLRELTIENFVKMKQGVKS